MTVPSRAVVTRPGQPAGQAGVRGVQRRVGGDHPADQAGPRRQEGQPERAAPVLDHERQVGEADGVGELRHPVGMRLHRVRRPRQRLVRAPEADEVGSDGAQAVLDEPRHDGAVEIGPGRLSVQQQDGLGARRPLVDVVHAHAVGQRGVVGLEREPRQVGEPLVGRPHDVHGAHSAAALARRPGDWWTRWP